jgi:hypothetical protein
LNKIVVYILIISLYGSCSFFKRTKIKNGQEPIARVYDEYLYKSDVKGVGAGAAKPEDSVMAVRSYIDSWIRHALLLHYAEENLPENNDQIDQQLQDYKESLEIYLYEKNLVAQKLDTVVTDKDVSDYYGSNKDIFNLKDPIFQIKYLLLKKNFFLKGVTVPVDSVRKWIKINSSYNSTKLSSFAKYNAVNSSVADSVWFTLDQLQKIFTNVSVDLINAPYSSAYQETTDSNYHYFIKFNGYKLKGNDAPLSYVKDEIKNIILNKRKLDFINSIQNGIYKDALKSQKIETY